ncbi:MULTISPECIES: DUF305 domain-containing protein [Microbacterium]|jgi:uncharacterized protein (DUF305 family)|uniref:DUF305 domain-containing protein n=1 Tax=Microbacterium TaxID=33882 RepID=UPI0010F92346|nr:MULTISPECIES: DUF305 domain-containing protein [unclassified Microbacterium]MBN9152389.1 DUF305 domain-containing protein [Microbacterium sp.]MCK9913877.1 DUF305 domain-containing protein [Microbacteriaceae bacterium K1510]
MRFRTLTLTAGVLAAAIVLAGCTSTSSGSMPGMDHGSGGMSSTAPSPAKTATFNMADQMFVTMMIPHHEQAVEMADQVLSKSGIDDRVVALAKQIKAAQGPEIQTMKGWLTNWGIPSDESTSGGMNGMGSGDGMMTGDDMAALKAATGAEASRVFLKGMIAHHQGAVTMAQTALKEGKNPDVRALAQQIIDGQTAEITTMQDILATL